MGWIAHRAEARELSNEGAPAAGADRQVAAPDPIARDYILLALRLDKLLPGLVDAHCQLDYTDLAGQIAPPRSFTDWLKCLVELKRGWGYSDFAQSWLNGARMLVRTGTTTVGDIEAVPDLLPELWEATPLSIFSFLEMTGIHARRRPADVLHEAVQIIESLRHPRNRAVLSR